MQSTPLKDESPANKNTAAPSGAAPRRDLGGLALKPSDEQSFAKLLDRLGAPDDHHRLIIQNGDHAGENVELSEPGNEIIIGFDNQGNLAWTPKGLIASACATVRHDWGGVHLTPNLPGEVRINGASINTQQTLKNGDLIELIPNDGASGNGTELVFREPLSAQVIPRVLLPGNGQVKPTVSKTEGTSKMTTEASVDSASHKLILGLFTPAHLAIIVICTLLGAIAVFLALNWIDSQF